jgi:hypothetical protein
MEPQDDNNVQREYDEPLSVYRLQAKFFPVSRRQNVYWKFKNIMIPIFFRGNQKNAQTSVKNFLLGSKHIFFYQLLRRKHVGNN